MSVFDSLQPWLMSVVGLSLIINGLRMLQKPNVYLGVGLIPASNPRTVKIFGIASLIFGLLGIAFHLPRLLSE